MKISIYYLEYKIKVLKTDKFIENSNTIKKLLNLYYIANLDFFDELINNKFYLLFRLVYKGTLKIQAFIKIVADI